MLQHVGRTGPTWLNPLELYKDLAAVPDKYESAAPLELSPAYHFPSSQIDNLDNGTDYYVRVAAYNGDGDDNTFTTYGAPADASPFPIMTMEQVSTYVTGPPPHLTKSKFCSLTLFLRRRKYAKARGPLGKTLKLNHYMASFASSLRDSQ